MIVSKHNAAAWTHHIAAPPYVIPRILWLQLALISGEDSQDIQLPQPTILLGRLKTALQSEDAHMEWTMDPVLAHLRPKLSAENHALLVALVAALSSSDAMDGLEGFLQWRDQAPLPLDE